MRLTYTDNLIQVEGLTHFDLAETLDCGQCFRFAPAGDGWRGFASGRAAVLSMQGDALCIEQKAGPAGETAGSGFWVDYLDLERDYEEIWQAFQQDFCRGSENGGLLRCMAYAPGIRVLHQPAWEALAAFIMSQNNNVPRIKGIIERLCTAFGDPLAWGYDFPPPERLAGLGEEDLRVLRCGWRWEYLLDAAEKVASGLLPLDQVAVLPLPEARQALQSIKGVGPKVAECVLLYGMGRLEAFPLDVWMKRAMKNLFPGKKPEDFGPYAGIAQQYIFHYCRTHPDEIRAG